MKFEKFNNQNSILILASLFIILTTGILFGTLHLCEDETGSRVSSDVFKNKFNIYVHAESDVTNNTDEIEVGEVAGVSVEYDLPFPGILPDNPLYKVKKFRDGMWLFLTRDQMKKAELLLLFSDKKISMAQNLAEKKKWSLAQDTLVKSQDDVEKMIEFVDLSEKIGVAPSDDFIRRARSSNEKHAEVIRNILSVAPQDALDNLETVRERNRGQRDLLEAL